jgi:hypothetical protein
MTFEWSTLAFGVVMGNCWSLTKLVCLVGRPIPRGVQGSPKIILEKDMTAKFSLVGTALVAYPKDITSYWSVVQLNAWWANVAGYLILEQG